jgi:hypothetical protein
MVYRRGESPGKQNAVTDLQPSADGCCKCVDQRTDQLKQNGVFE